jgi:hypothetical protein
MSTSFEAWKAKRQAQGSTLESKATPVPGVKKLDPHPEHDTTALAQPTPLREEYVRKIPNDYRSQVSAARKQMSGPPSTVGSVRSTMSEHSVVQRLAQMELALTKLTESSIQQQEIMKKQDKLIALLVGAVVGSTPTPSESASQ